MKILLRFPIPTQIQPYTELLSVSGKSLVLGKRTATLPSEPGVYYVHPYDSKSAVKHGSDELTVITSIREYHHSKEAVAALSAANFNGIIAAYALSDSGEEILLINRECVVNTAIADSVEVVRESVRALNNISVLNYYASWVPTLKSIQAKSTLLRKIVTQDCLAMQQAQIDLLMQVIIANPKLEKPSWFDALAKTIPAITDEAALEVIAEIQSHRSYLASIIAEYKESTKDA